MAENRLYRSESDRMVAGVCGGIAEVYDFDPSLVRVLTALLILSTWGTGLFAYILAWIIIPPEEVEKA
ncbi:MAG: PspC domain-containing protein [Candidatus Nanohaloarchaea archaeon]